MQKNELVLILSKKNEINFFVKYFMYFFYQFINKK